MSSYSVSTGLAVIEVKLECMPLQQIVFICVPAQRGYSIRGGGGESVNIALLLLQAH